ncbi:hypothetical protein FAY30_26650 (plasmid) [Bacillus sp. S3]|uniref:hypothetical protein n=1 Tax=Bacillus sp. S3 TaxID=486398 RepID=UPI00118ACBC2|nr:hypothetical protein [Bacillus sp. S3]QCJ45521.1 hypothetical protein FAY30_26650 [Bacillus sp. S3]
MNNEQAQSKDENSDSQQKDTKFDVSEFKVLFLLLAPISLGFGLLGVKIFGFSFDDLGTYGDFIGGGTIPFLTIASILYVVETIKLQKKQLIIQEKEINDTKKTLEEQNKTARMQRFENTFFIFLEQLNTILKDFNEVDGFHLNSPNEFFKILQNKYKYIKDKLYQDYEIHRLNENNREAYFQKYGEWLEEAYLKLPIDNSYHNYSFHVEKLLQLILKYRSEMDEWEIDFYLELVLNKIGPNGTNMLLYAAVLKLGIDLEVVKDIGLINYTPPPTLDSRRDYDFFQFVIQTEFNISDS